MADLAHLCGAVRLARFNVEARSEPADYFRGLPIPAYAIMLVSFYLTFRNRLDLFEVLNQGVISVLIPVIIVLSFLMVSTIPFDKIPPFGRERVRKHKGRPILFAVYFLIIIVFYDSGLLLV